MSKFSVGDICVWDSPGFTKMPFTLTSKNNNINLGHSARWSYIFSNGQYSSMSASDRFLEVHAINLSRVDNV